MPWAIAATVISTAVAAYGQIRQGEAESASAKYNEQVAANNAEIAKQNADYASKAGEAQAAQKEQETRAKVGGIKAAEAASGVDVNTGSAVDVRSSAAETGQLDAITIRSNAARQAYGYQVQGYNEEAQSTLDAFTADNAITGSQIGAAGTLLGGLGKAGDQYIQYRKNNNSRSGF